MKHILVIAPEYCSSGSPNGQIERHFFPQLPKNSYHCTIICNEKWNYVVESDNCEIVRTRFHKWTDYACRFMFHTPLHYVGNVPDKEYYCWGQDAIKEALMLSEKQQFDLIHSISMPCSAHVVAREIKKKLNIPWIAQFYDPWSGNPFRVMKSRKMLEIDRLFEKQVALDADLIIHPCDAMVDYWNVLFGDIVKDKITVLPFVTEIPSYTEHKYDGSKLVISHIGNFSQNRRASVFIEALSKLDNDVKKKIVVNFVGGVEESDVQLIEQYGLQEIIRLIGRVSENECHDYYVMSDLFLIVDINCSPNLFYPSKILKYFCYKKPIIGITTEQSVIREELEKTGNFAFNYYDADGIASFLTRAVADYASIQTNDKKFGARFSAENVIKDYCKLVDGICQ